MSEFLSSLFFISAYFAILLLPGFVLQKTVFRSLPPNLLSYLALSYSGLVLLIVFAVQTGVNAQQFSWFLFFLILVCSLLSLTLSRRTEGTAAIIALGFLSAGYQLIVGAFAEVPADAYAHLERYQNALVDLETNTLGSSVPWMNAFKQGIQPHYTIAALVADVSGISGRNLFEALDFSHRTLFLIAVYCFTQSLFSADKYAKWIAAMACFFIFTHFGTNVFAYLRYYSLAPSILCLPLYFLAVQCAQAALILQNTFSWKFVKLGLVILLLTATAAASHVQEALFIAIIFFAMAFVFILVQPWTNKTRGISDFVFPSLVVIAGAMVLTLAFVYSQAHLPRAPNAHWRLWEFSQGLPWLPKFQVLNLKFQFAEVVTVWGLFVYGLFLFHIRKFKHQLFLLAAMFSPALTFLNPYFVDLFLRHYNATTLWRFCYLLPLHFVAAYFFIDYLRKLKETKFSVLSPVYSLILILLVVLVVPGFDTAKGGLHSRVATIKASQDDLDYTRFDGLLDFLDSVTERKKILADPMLGYMISGLTKHDSPRRKFFRNYRYNNFTFQTYEADSLNQYRGFYIVAPKTMTKTSEVGALSGHWRPYEWYETRHYYPQQLKTHLEQNPNSFVLRYTDPEVALYEIL